MKRLDYKIGEAGLNEVRLSKHEIITNRIIEALESNVVPWKKPWDSLAPQNLFSKKEYRGINFILLSMVNTKYPYFATFKQVQDAGGSILKGSKSLPVYFYSPLNKKENEENDAETEDRTRYFVMKQYQVFTCEQIDGIDFSYHMGNLTKDFKPVDKAEEIIKSYIESQGLSVKPANNAGYNPKNDCLIMPAKELFHSEDSYYSTMFHEILHSTGSEKRLKREGFDPREYHVKTSEVYAFEELVAEFGAAMLCGYCGIDNRIEEAQSTAYIKGWLEIFKQDSSIAYKAASKAQTAVDFILNRTPT